jgi:hypothetical protein
MAEQTPLIKSSNGLLRFDNLNHKLEFSVGSISSDRNLPFLGYVCDSASPAATGKQSSKNEVRSLQLCESTDVGLVRSCHGAIAWSAHSILLR